jgi:predicted DNA-binding protein (UPF0251 family)
VLRAERARKRRETEVAALTAAATITPPHSDSVQIISLVDEAIAELPEELRVAVTEHFLCGRSQTELAQRLGVNQSTISRRVDAGLTQIRRRLRQARRDLAGIAGVADAAGRRRPRGRARAGRRPRRLSRRSACPAPGAAGDRQSAAVRRAGIGALTKVAAALLLSRRRVHRRHLACPLATAAGRARSGR